MVHFKRFLDYDSEKINTPVEYPMYDLRMDQYVVDEE
jgi:hypothetical protein